MVKTNSKETCVHARCEEKEHRQDGEEVPVLQENLELPQLQMSCKRQGEKGLGISGQTRPPSSPCDVTYAQHRQKLVACNCLASRLAGRIRNHINRIFIAYHRIQAKFCAPELLTTKGAASR